MQPVREVYSLLMPVQDGRIIVPRAAVAEVMGYTRPKQRPDDAPEFVLGFIEWQRQQIPLVSFEAARGRDVPELGRRTRIAVVFGIGGRLKPDVFAIVTQGYPYLVRVNENVLQTEAMEADDPLVLARVRMANEKPYIPDLERLETLIADGLGIEPAGPNVAADVPVDELDAVAAGDEEEFGAGIVETETGANTEEVNVDFDEVTSFGTETSHSPELDALSEALEANDEGDAVEDPSVDLEEVTAFGVETNYSAALDELSEALQEDSGAGSEESGDNDVIDLSGLELENEENTGEPEVPGISNDDSTNDAAGEFDLSDLELDSDDEKDDK